MGIWTLYVADQLGNRQAQIDVYHSLELVARHNAVSTWTLELPTGTGAGDAIVGLEHPRLVVRYDNTTLRSGPMSAYQRTVDADGDNLTVVGVDDTVWLARRLAHPTPGQASPPYNQAYDDRAGSASQVIAQYVDVNAGPSAVVARRVPGLTVPVPAPAGGSIDVQARYENLLDFVVGIAETCGLGVRIVDLALDVFVPQQRDAVFSVDLGTLAETTTSFDAPDANYVYVAGQGEGEARTIVEVYDYQSTVDWGRIETFQDRRDTNDTAKLTFAGNETLERAIKPRSVEFAPLNSPVQEFGRDWTVGDLVTVRVGQTIHNDIVREVSLRLEAGKPAEVSARLGAAGQLAIFAASLNTNRRIRQLERV